MQVTTVPLEKLTEDPRNARSHPGRNMDAIAESLSKFGQVEPLVVQRSSGVVIGGNGRLLAMHELGWSQAEVVYVDLDDARATALGLALNRTGDLAEWDYGQLSELIGEITNGDFDVDLDKLGWKPFEVEQLLAADWNPPTVDPDYQSPDPTASDKDGAVVIELAGDDAKLFAEVAEGKDPAWVVTMLCQFYIDEGGNQ